MKPDNVTVSSQPRDAIQPSLDGITQAFDAEFVTLAFFEGFAGWLVVFQVVELAAPRFVVDATGPRAVAGLVLHLLAVYAAGCDFLLFALPLVFLRLGVTVTADLHAGVETGVHSKFELQHEIAEFALGA